MRIVRVYWRLSWIPTEVFRASTKEPNFINLQCVFEVGALIVAVSRVSSTKVFKELGIPNLRGMYRDELLTLRLIGGMWRRTGFDIVGVLAGWYGFGNNAMGPLLGPLLPSREKVMYVQFFVDLRMLN